MIRNSLLLPVVGILLLVLAACTPTPSPSLPDAHTGAPTPTITPDSGTERTPPKKEKTIYATDFTRDDTFWVIDPEDADGDSRVSGIEGGRFWISLSDLNHSTYTTPNIDPRKIQTGEDFAVETKIKVMTTEDSGIPAGDQWGGMVWDSFFNSDETETVAYFQIYNDGVFAISSPGNNTDSELHYLKEWTPSDAINPLGDNVLRIEWRSGIVHFFINGTEVFETPREKITYPGLVAGPGVGLGADYFRIELIP